MTTTDDTLFLRELNVDGWEALFYDESGEEVKTEAEAMRWEQWFIAGDAYVYVTRDALDDYWSHPKVEGRRDGGQNRPGQEDVGFLVELHRFVEWTDLRDFSRVHPKLRFAYDKIDQEVSKFGHTVALSSGLWDMLRFLGFHASEGRGGWKYKQEVGTVYCLRCGRVLGLGIEKDFESVEIRYQMPRVSEGTGTFDERIRKRPQFPGNTPCPLPKLVPMVVPFTCRSGRMVLGNDFRKYFKDRKGFDLFTELESPAGMMDWISHLATFGYLSGFVGNTGIDFVPKDGGFDVMERLPEQEEGSSVHHVSTELWWFAILDAADLPEDATDSYDRKIGFIDLEPGDYTMTYHLEIDRSWDETDDEPRIWAEIRKASSPP